MQKTAQSKHAQRAKPSAGREVTGAFANFERLKLNEEQTIYREYIEKKF